YRYYLTTPSFSATADGNPFNETVSTDFTAQAGLGFPCAPCTVGVGPSADLTGGNAWVIGVPLLYDDDPAFDPNAWTNNPAFPGSGPLMSIVFSQPMSVVEFYAATLSPAGASFDILDPINGDTLFVPIPIVGGGDFLGRATDRP
ncbi:MAG: hypothetical protein AAEJ43_01855, partial [Gammaproteobacteria bacterium]